ncbi:Uncharacterised protein [Klebsiella aerogenes]|nr:Uncharacterised protein [Klebsiella aerogenes]
MFRNQTADNGVACFVVSGRFFLRFRHHHGATFRTHHDFVFRFFELNHRNNTFVAASSKQRRFVDQVRQVRTREARGTARNDRRVDIRRQRYATHMHFQDLFTTANIRQTNDNLTVEAAWTQQRGVQNVRTVSRRDNDNTFVTFEAVHFNQHLVQGLLTFIVTTAKARATLAADGVDFIDEDDARRCFLSLLEHVTHTRCTDTDEHFDEIRTGNCEERHFCFASDRFRQQRFTSTRRADHQDAFRDLTAQFLEAARLTQVFHQLTDFLFRFVTPGNVGKSGFDLVFRQHTGFAFAEGHRALPAAALHLPHKEDPDADQQQHWEPGDEDGSQQAWLFWWFANNFDVFSQQVIEQLRIVNRNVSRVTVTIFLGNVDLTSVDTRFANLVLIDLLQEGRIIHLAAIRLAGPKALEY